MALQPYKATKEVRTTAFTMAWLQGTGQIARPYNLPVYNQ